MKKLLTILVVFFVCSCDSESSSDCFQTTGDIISKTIEIDAFEKILVNRNIELTIIQGSELKAFIETGENLMNDVEVKVIDGELQLTDYNTCNLFRAYDPTKITITTPGFNQIRSSTQFEVKSEGLLILEKLQLLSEDYNTSESFNVGDFNLQLDVENLVVVSNNISVFYLSGTVNKLSVGFYAGAGRFEGADLIANTVEIYHRGSNDMVVHPQHSLIGELVSTGNLISKNRPAVVDVEEKFKGKLYFED
ncbi:head GIN domain-containing protein [Formosa sp. PL04]|uniref:head GIN domain-containing protein n=1 Tax=Formosa sp. PL04 TaxID=3081755 RepID=UPI002980BA2D|nr:head GIN domain-containing protein [Formosa sp. PL04]MDW5287462.1 head GIN domain-containing protein [Formosa sp. PL04]